MRESGYYPPGAEFDPNAPYNEVCVPEEDFDLSVYQTVHRGVTVTTDKYNPVYDDETGYYEADTSDTDWREVYGENCFDIMELLKILKGYVTADLANIENIEQPFRRQMERRRLEHLIEEIDSWEPYELDIEEEGK